MAGPCSQPEGNYARWTELNEIVCNVHFDCTPEARYQTALKRGAKCDLITYRMWLLKRNRLRTGKTL
jgi:hypothetical protein